MGHSRFTQHGSSKTLGFEETTFALAGGVQVDLGNDWHVGAAYSYESRSLDKAGMMDSDGDVFHLGAVAKREFGPALLAASLSAGYGTFDVERQLFLGDIARGSQEIWTVSGQIRGEYQLDLGSWFAKPRLDLGVDAVRAGNVRETGAAGFNHQISGSTETYVNIQPAVEVGGEWAGRDGTLYRPSLTLGVTQFLSDAAPGVSSLFDGSPAGAPEFEATSQFDRLYLDVGLGLEVLSTENMVLSAEAFGSFSDTTEQYGAGLRISIPF
ncbi:autotransporter domain-containing protein [Poseidonocella sp. HB161398]|uniref:autotransporter outer membrane beta-barrel domain-containing protein n=1 Tax=Poseidonocella sp. HB161398 TaxID=2320855 RepID=UPI0021073BF6|nr:autotransporter outer membrane beta-barrel domain-containing protein [Poseidonocella sp. HB161398]